MPIVTRATASDDVWEAVCGSSPEATPFHTPHWARALVAGLPRYRAAPLFYRFADGVTALLPLFETGPRGTLCQRVSVAPGVYGGPISSCTLSKEHWQSIACDLAEHSPGGCVIVGNPFANCGSRTDSNVETRRHGDTEWDTDGNGRGIRRYPADPEVQLPFPLRVSVSPCFKRRQPFAIRNLTTHVLSLEAGRDAVWRGMSKGHRCNVKQAERLGVTVSTAAGPEDVSAYYAVYLDSIRRWGEKTRSRYPEALFHGLLAQGDRFARLWLARSEGQVVSGALVLSWGEGAVYWHGATLERAFALRPSHAVVMAAMEDALSRGCRWFDFNPSGGLEGVIRFKEGFGARPVSFHYWELPARPAVHIAQRVVRRLMR